jgi:hypothetical protein
MWSDRLDADGNGLFLNGVDDAPLSTETRRPKAGELPHQLFVVKALDRPKALRTGLTNDRAPEFVFFGLGAREPVERFLGVVRLENAPHLLIDISSF